MRNVYNSFLSTMINAAGFKTILILASIFLNGQVHSQNVTVGDQTALSFTGLASSPLMAGTNNHAILGFRLSKAGGGGNMVTDISISLSQDPTNVWTNARLYLSSNTVFDGVGSETFVASGTFDASTITFSGSPLTDFGGSTGSTNENYFVVVDILLNVSGSATMQASLSNTEVTVTSGSTVASSSTGINYSHTALTTTITSLNAGANNVATSPLTGGSTGQAVFGFSLSSSGSQTVTAVNIQFSSDPTTRFTNYSLVRSDDTDFNTSGDNTTIGSLTFTPSATQVAITGLNEDVSTAKNYFLVVDVMAAPTGIIQASLGSSNVTVNQGVVSGSATGTNYSFLTTVIDSLNAGANNVATSPLIAGTTGKAVFGFSLTSGGTQTVTEINVQLSSTPSGKLSNWSLVRSTDADFVTSGDNTTIGSLTFTPSATQVSITGLSESITGTAKNYFLVADVDPAVTGATPAIQASLGASNVTVATGAVSGSATGTNYSFQTLITTIGSLNTPGTHNVATSPLTATATGKAVFGFSLTSTDNQTVTVINVQLSSDPAGKLSNWSLVRSTDANFATTGDNTVIGSLTFTPTSSQVGITGLNESITTTVKNYFLVADVDPGVTGATPAIQASLSAANVTVNAGTVSGSANGVNYSFQTLNTTIGSLNAGANNVATSPLAAGATGKAVFGFSLTSTDNQTVTVVNVQLSSDPAGKLSNWSMVRSTDADFATTGDNTTIGSLTFTPTGSQVGITGLNESITTVAKNYFLVADVDPAVTDATPAIQASLGSANVTVNAGSVSGTATGTNYSFAPLTATLAQLTTGIAASPLIAGTAGSTSQNAILGFSLVSNGNQTVSSIKVAFDTDPAGKFTSYGLVLSTDNSFTTTGDNSTVSLSSSTVSGTGPYYVDLVPTSAIDISTTKNLFLVVTVDGGVNSTTVPATITPSLSSIDITVNQGSVAANSFSGTAYSFQASQASTIAIHSTAGTTSPINFAIYSTQTATSGLTWGATPNSTSLANFRIRDGGGSSDTDNQETKITSFTITITNPQDLETVAIFYGTSISNSNTKVGEQPVGSGTITFSVGAGTLTQALVAADNSDAFFTVRTTFKETFPSNPDNNTHVVAVTAATADPNGSQLSSSPLTLATTGTGATINNITVVATRLVFIDPDNPPAVNPIFTGPVFANAAPSDGSEFSATVAAVDGKNNIDLDNTASVTLNITPSASVTFTGGGAQSLVNGTRTFSPLTINKPDIYDLGATGGGLTAASAANETSLVVVIQSAGITISSAANLSVCKVSSETYTTLPNIVMTESNAGDFGAGTSLSFLLVLPSGWEFKTTGVTPSMTATPGNNFVTPATFSGFLGNTIAKFTYSVSGTNKIDVVTISGFEVRNVGGVASGVITRGGTGIIAGCCDDTKPLGTLTTAPSALADFTVESYPGQAIIPPTTTKFSRTSSPIILNGESPPGSPATGVFSGAAVSYVFITELGGSRYVFNPSILSQGIYPITFAYEEAGTGCLSEATKNFEVFEGAINNLSPSYCADNTTPQNITVNSAFIPPNSTVVQEGGMDAFTLIIPSYKFITEVINNNNGTVTVTVKNHGFTDGQEYWIYIASGFSGPDAPYGYIYKLCTVSNTTTDQFDINADVTGSWDYNYGIVYLPANYYTQITDVIRNATSLTITAIDHGFSNGARPYMYLSGFTTDTGTGYVEGFYEIKNATRNTFEITVTTDNASSWTGNGYVYSNWYRITSLTPDVKLLNRKLLNVTTYEVGYFVKYDWCTYWGCDIYYYVHNTPVLLYPLPIVSFTGLKDEFCDGDPPVTLTGSETSGSFSINAGIITDLGNGTATFNVADVPYDTPLGVTYSYTNINGCTGVFTDSTILYSRLAQPIANDTAFCEDSPRSSVIAKSVGNAGATIYWYSDPQLPPPPEYIGSFFPADVNTGSPITVPFYTTQWMAGSCESQYKTVNIQILPAPDASFESPPPCVDREFSVSCPSGLVNCDWNFGDGGSATGETVTYTYTRTGSWPLQLIVTDNEGCTNSLTQQVGVGPNPIANFSFDQNCNGDVTEFHAPIELSNGDSFEWDFGDGNTSPRLTDRDRLHQFAGIGSYNVTLRAYFNNNCYTDTTKTIPILHYIQNINKANPFIMASLDGGKGYWLVEDVNGKSTWDFAVVNKETIKSASEVWVTNPSGNYLPGDRSYLNSPCLDISGLDRPVISLDYILNTNFTNIDGVAMEYSTNGGKNWSSLGSTTSGQNWYNTQGFFAGNIGVSQVGWSGDLWNSENGQIEWLTGKHKLDDLTNKSKVRLRIAFVSDGAAEFDGFAFTNLKIEERNRLVLVENFTNTQFDANNGNFNSSMPEAVKIQYHLPFPGQDNISVANQPDPSARAAFYGIAYNTQSVPRGYVDGYSGGNFATPPGWYNLALDSRSLASAPYTIAISTLNNTPDPELLKIHIDINRLSPIAGTPVLHVAVIEKTVGTNDEFEFVVRKLLPTAAGTYLAGLDAEQFDFTWKPEFPGISLANITDFAIVAFIQDVVTQEVHQANILMDPADLPTSIITGLEDPSFADKIHVYPNPANDEVNILLPEPARTQTPVVLMDAHGRVLFNGSFRAGQQQKTISTSDFAGGMYFLQITTKENVARKKVMIVHPGN